jgi:hypothetical protein
VEKIEEKVEPALEILIPCSPIIKIINAHNREVNLS